MPALVVGHRGESNACTVLRGVHNNAANVVHKQRVEQICNFFLVRELESALVGNPAPVSTRSVNRDRLTEYTYQTPFRCIGPIFTTLRFFSLLRIPSRLPLVMPATLSSLVPLMVWLSSRRATQIPFASTWKQRLASSSHKVAVTFGLIPGGAICPVVSIGRCTPRSEGGAGVFVARAAAISLSTRGHNN